MSDATSRRSRRPSASTSSCGLLAFNGVDAYDFGGYIAGTPTEVADVIRRHLDLGFETVIVRMPAPYDQETIERMREVADLLVS
jgi:alkanesulfonate monooxygenase SsuD/methylene tetrahydromethanopterin reductase-like flavin-dependent oxidoreductase (luciferase family)